jgi:cytochrome c oxidase cbb3-type subunit 3
MKFKNYLETIAGVEIFPMISLLVFVVFFVALIFYVVKADKNYIEHMQQIPFDKEQ